MYPNQPRQVAVPITMEAVALDTGTDLVARIGQVGTYGYRIVRVWITGPVGQFLLYAGSTAGPSFSSVYSAGVADAQFQPGETIPPGTDVIGVWKGATGFAGTARMVITTDGGL